MGARSLSLSINTILLKTVISVQSLGDSSSFLALGMPNVSSSYNVILMYWQEIKENILRKYQIIGFL